MTCYPSNLKNQNGKHNYKVKYFCFKKGHKEDDFHTLNTDIKLAPLLIPFQQHLIYIEHFYQFICI